MSGLSLVSFGPLNFENHCHILDLVLNVVYFFAFCLGFPVFLPLNVSFLQVMNFLAT